MNIGLLVLSSDPTVEIEFKNQLSVHNIYVSRINYEDFCRIDTLSNLEEEILYAAESLPDLEYSYIVFACTSGSILLGHSVRAKLWSMFSENTKILTPSYCLKSKLVEMQAKNITVITPYVDEVHISVCNWFQDNGFNIVSERNFSKDTDREISMIDPILINKQIDATHPTSDAVVLSCTALPDKGYLSNKKVVSSNSAMIDYIRRYK